MPAAKNKVVLLLMFFGLCAVITSQEQKITVTGKLVRALAVGGESTGWMLQLESEVNIHKKKVSSVELASPQTEVFEKWQNRHVQVTGKLSYRTGVETGRRSVLDVSSLKEVRPESTQTPSSASSSLVGSEWLLKDLAGSKVLENATATLAFPESAKVAGRGSCNRFFGAAKIIGNTIQLGSLGSTRMACPEAVMDQEAKYLKALEAAERWDRKGSELLLYCRGFEQPLRFMQKEAAAPDAAGRDLTSLFGRIWQVIDGSPKPASGSIYVFLANGTLLETSCVETYRIARWSVDKNAPSTLRVVEENQLAYTAVIVELTNRTLQWRQNLVRSHETRSITLKAMEQELACPDMPK